MTKSLPGATLSLNDSGMNLGLIDLNLLIVFDALMHERNLTRAGKRIGLRQPAASHALAKLRQTLHDDLFIRTPRECSLPPVRSRWRNLRAMHCAC
jgi:hypothetical protein